MCLWDGVPAVLDIVEERHPLKQGLKLNLLTGYERQNGMVEERHPLKQGLKLARLVISLCNHTVEERHPLKQGLKPGIVIPEAAEIPGLKRDIH